MKRYKRSKITCGINPRYNEETKEYTFDIDFDENQDSDVIQFLEPYYFESKLDGDVFWFGYKFNDGVDSKLRKAFINFMKDVGYEKWVDPEDEWSETYFDSNGISESDLRTMIIQSVNHIGLRNYDIDLIVSPESAGRLTNSISRCLQDYLNIGRKIDYQQLIKAAPSEIRFNIEKCLKDIEEGNIKVPSYVDEAYLKKIEHRIKTADRFSMRQLVHPPVLRMYVDGIFKAPVMKPLESAESILIVDDFKTSGTTIRQMIKTIRTFNTDNVIYVYTLFGKTGKL